MSVYIPGMEMPKSCRDCGIEQEGFWCGALEGYQNTRCFTNERREDCPLFPVPPHGDLIDRDALMKMCGMATDCYDCPNGEHGWCKRSQDAANICEAIEDAPTIIPAEGGEG